jgi:hypothetical protein
MDFEQKHAEWIGRHLAQRTGERRGRLERGYRHAEPLFVRNVWWPVIGSLDDLHPEYEVMDWRGRSYFADLAYLPGGGPLKLLIEIKGFAAHVRDMDRKRFCDECNRELFLQSLGYRVASFAYDDVAERPELCAALLRMLLSRYRTEGSSAPLERHTPLTNEMMRLAYTLARPIRPKDVTDHLRINRRTAVDLLRKLCAQGKLRPVGKPESVRVMRYELAEGNWID